MHKDHKRQFKTIIIHKIFPNVDKVRGVLKCLLSRRWLDLWSWASQFWVGEVKLDLSWKISNRKEAYLSEEYRMILLGNLISPKLNGINRKEKFTQSELDFRAMMSSFWPFLPEIMPNISSSFNPCHYAWVNAMILWWKFLIKRALLLKCSPFFRLNFSWLWLLS